MRKEESYIPPVVRRVMPGATEAELLEATETLRRYLKAMYALYRELEAQGAERDSCDLAPHDRVRSDAQHPDV